MKLAPIVLFVYNRLVHTKKTIESLKRNNLAKDTELFIYSDGPKNEIDEKNVQDVRKYIQSVSGFKNVKIIERDKNLGLANSIISGVTEVINKYGKVIVIEDDLITSPAFLNYMNKLLDIYKNDKKVYSITGYNFPPTLMKIPKDYSYDIYFSPRAGSWSWATWKDRWDKADWKIKDYNKFKKSKKMQNQFNNGGDDMSQMLIKQAEGKIDSWAIRWCYSLFKNNGLCIYPIKSYVNNIGLDGSGIHCGKSKSYCQNQLNKKLLEKLPDKITLNEQVMKEFSRVFSRSFFNRIKRKLTSTKLS